MKGTFLFSLLLLAVITSVGQIHPDTIEIRSKKLGTEYLRNGEKLSMRTLTKFVKSCPEAIKQLRKAKTSYFFTNLISFTGGAMIGWPIGRSIAGDEMNWGMLGAGVGVAGVAFAISPYIDRQIKRSVILYNENQFKKVTGKSPGELQSTQNKGTGNYNISQISFVLGLNLRRAISKPSKGVSSISDPLLGIQLGALYNVHDFGPFGLRTGYVLSIEGLIGTSHKFGSFSVYSRVPVLGQYFITDKISLNGGLNFDIWLLDSYSWEFNFESKSKYRWFNPGLCFGGEYKIMKNASLYLSYNPYFPRSYKNYYGTSYTHKKNILQAGINFNLGK